MTREEAELFAQSLEGDDRTTFNEARSAYVRVRARLNGSTAITRRMWRAEFGRRMSLLTAVAEPIEVLEGDQPAPPAVEGILPLALQSALKDLTTVLTREWLTQGAEEHKRFQELTLAEKARRDAEISAAKQKLSDVEAAGREASNETKDYDANRVRLAATQDELDQARTRMAKMTADATIAAERLVTAGEQNAALRERLTTEADRWQRQVADINSEHAAEVAALRATITNLEARVRELESGVFRVLDGALAKTRRSPQVP